MSPPSQRPSDGRDAAGAGRGAVAAVVAGALFVGLAVVVLGLAAFGAFERAAPDDGAATEVATAASSDGFAVWERNADGTPVRWDPCSPIDLVVATDGMPSGALEDLDEAVRRLAAASGLGLRVTGTTDERPAGDRPAYQPDRYGHRWAPVLIAWATPHEDGIRLRSTDRGVAVPIAVGPVGERTYVTAQIALNRDRTDLRPGFEDRSRSWGSTLLHELAHVLGLDHVEDPAELMYIHPGEGPVRFGPGDLAGLAAVGATHGCRSVPDPRPVEIADPTR